MAYEPPANVDFGSGFLIRGQKALQEYREWRRNFVRLRPELREAFTDDRSVNEALEIVLKLRQSPLLKSKKRKTA